MTACQDGVKFSPAAVPGGCCDAFRSSDKHDRMLRDECDRSVGSMCVCVNKCINDEFKVLLSLRALTYIQLHFNDILRE